MLRHAADRRTVAYLGLTTALVEVNWYLGRLHLVLYPLQLFMFFTAAVISHNHNHVSIWKAHWANLITSWVISLFYGHPAIAWVPTHNEIHHKLNNRPGDSSRSPKDLPRQPPAVPAGLPTPHQHHPDARRRRLPQGSLEAQARQLLVGRLRVPRLLQTAVNGGVEFDVIGAYGL